MEMEKSDTRTRSPGGACADCTSGICRIDRVCDRDNKRAPGRPGTADERKPRKARACERSLSPGCIPRGEHFIQSTWVSKRTGGDDRGDEKVKPEEEETVFRLAWRRQHLGEVGATTFLDSCPRLSSSPSGYLGKGQPGLLTQVEGQPKQPFLRVSPPRITILIYGPRYHARSANSRESVTRSDRGFSISLQLAIFANVSLVLSSSLHGVSRQHKPTKVIPKTAQVMQPPVGKKSGFGTYCGKHAARGNPDPEQGIKGFGYAKPNFRRAGLTSSIQEREGRSLKKGGSRESLALAHAAGILGTEMPYIRSETPHPSIPLSIHSMDHLASLTSLSRIFYPSPIKRSRGRHQRHQKHNSVRVVSSMSSVLASPKDGCAPSITDIRLPLKDPEVPEPS
ncbi:hypothetical protein EAG_08806 [Camponotus floridanus]|uniref:Uncharacterized protein n=1 Tax=Camponotus floridanus TaxID=104421 RepID=E2AYE2_CAMFO|nr:hypothetical protein EAG_08806 [Camponotus floridanus]